MMTMTKIMSKVSRRNLVLKIIVMFIYEKAEEINSSTTIILSLIFFKKCTIFLA